MIVIFFIPLPLLVSATGKLVVSVLALQQVTFNLEQLRLERIEADIEKNKEDITSINYNAYITNNRIADSNRQILENREKIGDNIFRINVLSSSLDFNISRIDRVIRDTNLNERRTLLNNASIANLLEGQSLINGSVANLYEGQIILNPHETWAFFATYKFSIILKK